MNIDIEGYCEQNGLDYPATLRLIDLYTQSVLGNVIYSAVMQAQNDGSENLAKLISSKIEITTKRGPGRPSGSSAKTDKGERNPNYAPAREDILCRILSVESIGDGRRAMITFMSLHDKSYGHFTERRVFTSFEIASLFYRSGEVYNPDDAVSYTPHKEVLEKIPNLPRFDDVSKNCSAYVYLLDVKRKAFDAREPHEVLSIKPYGLLEDYNHGQPTESGF